ncbi:restriction endonuclease subunit S [Rhodococcus erythropolis]
MQSDRLADGFAGEVCELIRNGYTAKQSPDAGGVPITRIETISKSTVDIERVGYADLDVSNVEKWLLRDGDILFSHINSVEHIGKCAVYRGEPAQLVHGMNLLCLRADPEIASVEFLKHQIRSPGFRWQLQKFVNKAVNQASVSIGNLKTLTIPLPPLPEQRRIAAILDQADTLRAKRREALAQLDELIHSIFVDMFGDPLARDNHTVVVPFGSVVNRVTYGFTNPMMHVESGIPILTAKNVQMGWLDTSSVHYATQSEFDALTSKSRPEVGDVLITKDGTIGRCAVVDYADPFCINQSVALVKPNYDKAVPDYLVGYLSSARVQQVLKGMKKGNAVGHLQITELSELPIPLVKLSKQLAYIRNRKQLNQSRLRHSEALGELDALFSSLQSRAFRGEL